MVIKNMDGDAINLGDWVFTKSKKAPLGKVIGFQFKDERNGGDCDYVSIERTDGHWSAYSPKFLKLNHEMNYLPE
jgi:hypothetical protein